MKNLLIILALILTTQVFSKTSSENHSKHASKSNKKLTLNQGKKWEIDQAMIYNMSAIITENKRLSLIKNASKDDYNKLSSLIASSADNIVKDCKLSPEADQAFHIILADLFTVSEHLKDAKNPKHAIHKLDQTLSSYIKYFNHPVTQ